jgi:hypothetical protein
MQPLSSLARYLPALGVEQKTDTVLLEYGQGLAALSLTASTIPACLLLTLREPVPPRATIVRVLLVQLRVEAGRGRQLCAPG